MISLRNIQISSYIAFFCCILLGLIADDVEAAELTIYADKYLEADSISIDVYDQVLNGDRVEYFNDPSSYTVAKKNEAFHFMLPVKKSSYINVVINKYKQRGKQILLRLYLLEPDDAITLRLIKSRNDTTELFFQVDKEVNNFRNYRNYDFCFTGMGSAKYQCRYTIDSTLSNLPHLAKFPFSRDGAFIAHNLYGDMETRALEVLRSYQSKISPKVFNLFELDIKSNWRNKLALAAIKRLSAIISERERILLVNKIEKFLAFNRSISDDQSLALFSKYQAIFQANLLRMKYCAVKGDDLAYNKDAFYDLLGQAQDPLREKTIMVLLCFRFQWMKDGDQVLKDALDVVQLPYYKGILQKMADATLQGKVAYNFSLPNQKGEMVKLSDFKGKVVFMDFWFTGCGACKYYFKGVLSKVEEQFKNQEDLVFVSVSVDRNKLLWQKSISEGSYTSEKIVNLYTEGRGSNCEIIRHYRVTGYPKPMIIDRQGKIFKYNDVSLQNEEGLTKQLNSALAQ